MSKRDAASFNLGHFSRHHGSSDMPLSSHGHGVGPVGGHASADVEMSMADDGSHAVTGGDSNANGGRGKMAVISGSDGALMEIPDLCVADYTVKIGLSLYKVQQSIYLLDFQKMTGDAFSFMTLCSNIITELKTLSAASKQQQAMLAQQHAARQAALQQQMSAQQK